ncbi:glycosyl hydrolase-related protein [Leifsonia xyli]|uniref:glycosyl hydrolase-related protein n=1 Tax=Leifsonia xyli TaxID=1575 RepID=UPI001CB7DE30|nr:glycosyl hydrolase-related protein [Leifsonia xyli]
MAEDGSGDVIVHLYESRGARATTTVAAGFPHRGIQRTDLLERELGAAEATLTPRPFELVTLRFSRG